MTTYRLDQARRARAKIMQAGRQPQGPDAVLSTGIRA
jgi:hypothetical protein